MPRGGSRGRSSSPPPRSSFAATKPAQQSRPPVQQTQQQSGGFLSGIGSTIMTGMAFGAGSQVAHQAVRGVMGGGSSGHEVQQQQPQQNAQNQYQTNPCQAEITNFSQCIQRNDDLSYCQNFSDMLKTCKQQNGL